MARRTDNAGTGPQPAWDTEAKPEVVISETEARSAQPVGRMRYVLAISTAVAIVALVLVYFSYV